jgi:imidazolonepropionase-like amidohydrolase
MAKSDYWPHIYSKKLTRRRLLKGGVVTGLGLTAAALVGCSGSATPSKTTFGPTETPRAANAVTATRTAAPRTPRSFLPEIPPSQTPEFVLDTHPIAILNGTLIDGTGAPPLPEAWVLLKDGRIQSVGSGGGTIPEHSGYTEIDAAGRTIMPGLVDAHVHISRQVLQLQPDLSTNVSGDSLLPFLKAGFTKMRDVGTATLIFTSMNSLVSGFWRNNKAPDIAWAGPIITTVGGYPISGNPRYATVAQEIISAEEGVGLVDQLADHGARVVKLGIEKGYYSDEGWPLLSLEEISAMCDRAHARGLLVTAHVTSLDEVRLAIDGGVDDFAHTPLERMPDELIQEMVGKKRGIVTTAAIWEPTHADTAADNAKRFANAGGRVAIGTDFGAGEQVAGIGDYLGEMQFLQSAGMTTKQLLTAATSGGAALANAGDETGTIVRDKQADVIIVDGDPWADLLALNHVSTVISGGRLVEAA